MNRRILCSPSRDQLICVSVIAIASIQLTEAVAVGPEPILLWPDGAPGAVGDEDQDKPQLRIYSPPPSAATGAAIIVCPGGGYGILATDHEGHQVAKWLNSIGVSSIVLKYRLGQRYRHPAPLNDAQRALRYVRANAAKLSVSPNRIGIMGFSAGGHLASTAATHFDSGDPNSDDLIERAACRPDFVVLGYPVISMTEDFGHKGSRRNLLGEPHDPKLAEYLSSEKQVTKNTPPAFLFHTGEDTGVPVENSLAFYRALRKAKVAAELHVYQYGPHGVGLAPGDPVLFGWKDRLSDWLKTSGFLADVRRATVSGKVTVDGVPLRWGTITFIPVDSPNKPVAWGRVSQGNCSVPANRGVVVGVNRVEIRSHGSVETQPTIDDVQLYTKSNPQTTSALRADVVSGKNEFLFQLRLK